MLSYRCWPSIWRLGKKKIPDASHENGFVLCVRSMHAEKSKLIIVSCTRVYAYKACCWFFRKIFVHLTWKWWFFSGCKLHMFFSTQHSYIYAMFSGTLVRLRFLFFSDKCLFLDVSHWNTTLLRCELA